MEHHAVTALSGQQRRIYGYVSAHRDGAGYLMAVQSWAQASPYILATGQEVMPMGGFSGSVPEPTLAQVRRLVHTGQLRFFLLGAGGGSGQRSGSGSTAAQVVRWVQNTCVVVPAKDYGGASVAAGIGGSRSGGTDTGGAGFGGAGFSGAGFSGSGPGFGDPDGGSGTLYLCGKAG